VEEAPREITRCHSWPETDEQKALFEGDWRDFSEFIVPGLAVFPRHVTDDFRAPPGGTAVG